MAERIPQSAALEVMFMAYLASDHVTPATGKTIAITISKNHAGLGNPNAGATNATAISNGCYYVALDTTDTGTLGNLWVHGAEGTIDDVNVFYRVVTPADVNVVSAATNAIAADSLAVDVGTEIADAVLTRGVENIEVGAGPHTLASAVLHSTGRTRRNQQTIETYRSDGTTLHMVQTLVPDPTGQPVSEIGDATTV